MTSTERSDPLRKPTAREYYPWWLDNLADDVTGEGAAMQGVLHGAENVRRLVLDARALYEHQEFEFTGDDSAVAKCFLLWAGLVGAISLEVFGQYGADTLTEPGAVFDTQVRLLIGVLDARTILD